MIPVLSFLRKQLNFSLMCFFVGFFLLFFFLYFLRAIPLWKVLVRFFFWGGGFPLTRFESLLAPST